MDVLETIAEGRFNKYSQSGEDGLLQGIFERIGTENKWCFDAGAGDGRFCSNTGKLIEEGWTGVLVEGDKETYSRLVKAFPDCHCENVMVEPSGENSIDNILARNKAPFDIDLLSLDIDGQDYHVFNALMVYKPRVVVIEYNFSADNVEFIPAVGGEGQAGLMAIEKMLYSRGYRPQFSTKTNVIAVRAGLEWRINKDEGGVRLNLGSGKLVHIDGYTDIDREFGSEVYPLDREDDSVDEIYASHILEHFGFEESFKVLKNWVSKLKVGGLLKIAVPDFRKISEKYLAGEKVNTSQYILGSHIDANDYHKALFDKQSLLALMGSVGLVDIKPWDSKVVDCASLPISLNLQGVKKKPDEQPAITTDEFKKIAAVMSMPRLCFADNMHTAATVFLGLGIELTRGTGVFWGQILSNMIEDAIAKGAEWIFTLDYDTWFLPEHVIRLCQLMQENPDVDAIIPVQNKRQSDEPLFGVRNADGSVAKFAKLADFEQELTPIGTGHFGLTVFRASALSKLKKPWIRGIPNPDGEWHENRQDPDIYFWNQFFKQGLKAVQANRVVVGHMQLMCSFPDVAKKGFKPIYMHMSDLDKVGPPAHCKPTVEMIKG